MLARCVLAGAACVVFSGHLAAQFFWEADPALASAVHRCWRTPPRMAGPPIEVRVRFSLQDNGLLEGAPRVDHASDDPYHQRLATTAVQAVQRCAPYRGFGPVRDATVSFHSSD
jgi:hypothetical protein